MKNNYTHIFLDMDGTVTRSRSLIENDMKELLKTLMSLGKDVLIVTGQGVPAIKTQVGVGTYFMGQNGNHVLRVEDSKELWREELSESERQAVLNHIASLPKELVKDPSDLVEDRGSQISYSILGHHEEVSLKEKYDKGGAKRRALIEKVPFISDTLEVKIAGTTSLDYIRKNANKGTNIDRLIRELSWDRNDSVYVGDSLFPGGNDEAVIGVIDTVPVADHKEAYEYLRSNLL